MGVQINGDTGNISATKADYSGNVTIGGTLTYEDVTNIDSVGLVTARSGIEIGARPGVAASISVDGNMIVSGISTFGGDVSIADKIIHTGDTDTAIRFSGADTIKLETGGSERLKVDSNGDTIASGTLYADSHLFMIDKLMHTGDTDTAIRFPAADTITAETGGSERLRITSDGVIGINDTNPGSGKKVKLVVDNNSSYQMAVNLTNNVNADLNCYIKTSESLIAPSTNTPLCLGSGGAEKLRIESSGGLRVGATGILIDHAGNGTDYETCSIKRTSQGVPLTIQTSNVSGGFPVMYLQSLSATATQNTIVFLRDVSGNPITVVGTIQTTGSSTSYNTSSDYRLKENEVLISDGITRLKTLKPYRFNWKIDPSTKVDGFFAHEVTAVPEAVSGTKDEVSTDENGAIPKGDPIYQTIDHSKLVPLLTAALQEAITRIETLESEVAALKSS